MINSRFLSLVAHFVVNFLFIWACVSLASAETIPLPSVQQESTIVYTYSGGPEKSEDEIPAVCMALAPNYPTWTFSGAWTYNTAVICSATDNGTGSARTAVTGYKKYWKCGSSYSLTMTQCTVQECPANQNWTKEGNTCTRPDCEAGFDRNSNGQCVKDCTGKLGQLAPSPSYEFANDGGTPSVGGCNVTCSTWRQSGGGTSLIPLVMVGDTCKYTGTSSANGGATEGTGFKPNSKEPTSPKDCIGSGMGYIQSSSGTTTCVASGEAPEGQKPVVKDDGSKTSGTPGTDGNPDPNSPDYKKEEKEVTRDDKGNVIEKNTITVNGTPDGSGGTTCPEGYTLVSGTTQCSKVTVTKSTTSDYCSENPKATACEGTEEADECVKNPDRVGCMDVGAVSDTPEIPAEDRGVSVINPVTLDQINSCPQGMLLPKGLGYYDFGPMCDFASGLKPVVLAIAWLSAFFIVLGFSQGDD